MTAAADKAYHDLQRTYASHPFGAVESQTFIEILKFYFEPEEAALAAKMSFQPETEAPPRTWRPLGLAVLYTGLVAGAAVALENTSLDLGDRREVGGVGFLALVTGLVMSVKKPDPRPVPANIQYNRLLREQIIERNAQIAEENGRRRQQVTLTITPTPVPAPAPR